MYAKQYTLLRAKMLKENGPGPLVCKHFLLFGIGSFTVVCLVTWSCIGSEAKGDPVLIQTSLLLMCK